MARRYAPTMLWSGARAEFDRQINNRCRQPLVGHGRNSKTAPTPEPDRPLTADKLAVLQQLITPPTAADINYGTSEGARKAAATRRQRGGIKGDTKVPRTHKVQINPYQALEGANDKTRVKALTRAIDKTARKGGTVLKSVHKRGIGHITVKGGSVGKKSDEYKGDRVIVDSELKFRSGRKNRKNSKIQTGFEEQ